MFARETTNRTNTFADTVRRTADSHRTMTDSNEHRSDDRGAELRELASRARDHAAVADAFVATSFTDQLLVVDLESTTEGVPPGLVTLFAEHGCYGANEVYDRDGDGSDAGAFSGRERHQFVDTETRGEHRSYVVE